MPNNSFLEIFDNMTDLERKKFLRKVMGPPKKTLEGKEKEQILLLLAMMDPFEQSNNQHSWTDSYKIGDTVYQLTSFPGEDSILDMMLPEDDDYK